MPLELVTGYWGMEHVTAEQDADLNAGIIGSGNYVLPVGEKMRAEVVTSNKIRIFDGIFIAYGRQCMLDSGDFEDVTIENGTAGMLRNDMIVVKYKKDEKTGYEKAEFAVLKGQTGTTAVDPVPNNQDIRDGAFESEVPMYRVKLNGLAIEKIEPLFEVTMTNKELADKYRELNSALTVRISDTEYKVHEKMYDTQVYARAYTIPLENALDGKSISNHIDMPDVQSAWIDMSNSYIYGKNLSYPLAYMDYAANNIVSAYLDYNNKYLHIEQKGNWAGYRAWIIVKYYK